MVETLVNDAYTKYLGTYDTSYAETNWRVDLPAWPNGTVVQYQLLTRNQSGQDYDPTGFKWRI